MTVTMEVPMRMEKQTTMLCTGGNMSHHAGQINNSVKQTGKAAPCRPRQKNAQKINT